MSEYCKNCKELADQLAESERKRKMAKAEVNELINKLAGLEVKYNQLNEELDTVARRMLEAEAAHKHLAEVMAKVMSSSNAGNEARHH